MRRRILLALIPIAQLLSAADASADVQFLRMRNGPIPDGPPAGAHLTYYGGRIISNVKVYAVNWGPAANITVASQIGAFYTAITSSAYFDWLGEYNTAGLNGQDGQPGSNQRIGRGSFAGSATLTGVPTSGTVTDDEIQAAISQGIASGALPQPDLDAAGYVNSIYMIDFPPGLTITGPGGTDTSCVQFCAYHGTASINGKGVPYGVLPDLGGACAGGCGQNPTPFNNATSVHSHELVEAVTDADVGLGGNSIGRPLAWYDSAANTGEIGDICNAMQTNIAGYTVQTEWSNAAGACIAQRTLPQCAGNNAPCTPCSASSSCSGATPTCATDANDLKRGQCVACTSNTQCSGATPICDKSGGTLEDSCRACATNTDCAGGTTPVCELTGTNAGRCVECNATSDCKSGATCNTATNTCVECQTAAQCQNPTPACSAQKCAACARDTDCAGSSAGAYCNVASGACGPHATSGGGGGGGTVAGADGGVESPGANPGYYYRAPNTNMTCAMSDGDAGSLTPAFGGIALLAAVGAARRRRAR